MEPDPFRDEERREVAALDAALFRAFDSRAADAERQGALRNYLETKARVARRHRRFDVPNNRIFRDGRRLIVPYAVGGLLLVHAVEDGGCETLVRRRFRSGTIFTDRSILDAAGARGQPIDLEELIFGYDVESAPELRVTRIRDLAAVLKRLNQCGSRHEVLYHMRFLVARLCSLSFQGPLGAKNLQPEVAELGKRMVELLNGPFSYRLRLPVRVLVRNVSGLLSQPKLIDELWKDTVDISEVQVRGSAITNEIRRSAHHSLGNGTLRLAQAYQSFLTSGDLQPLAGAGFDSVSAADEEARSSDVVRAMVERIVTDLEKILGASQIAVRIREWMESYAAALVGCDSRVGVEEELEALVEGGIRQGNRWAYAQHLRVLARKAESGAWASGAGVGFARALQALQVVTPDREEFDASGAEAQVRSVVAEFVAALRADHQDELFRGLEETLDCLPRAPFPESFERICELRRRVDRLQEEPAFLEHRYLLHQLDCMLEELGYLVTRHIASSYDEDGVQLDQCLRTVHLCAANLGYDGLFSRELWELSAMLLEPGRTRGELLDVLQQIQRNYHRLFHRVSIAYERMGNRLGLNATELRAMLGNFQRYMHDLNSMVHFSDLARTHLLSAAPRDTEATPAAPRDPYDILHLSHADEIARRIESWDPAHNLLDRYGGKGSSLVHISYLGLPTCDGFIVPADVPRGRLHIVDRERFEGRILEHLGVLEADLTTALAEPLRFGDPECPLLLAVRGGSTFSIPGMITTVVYVGMNDEIAAALGRDDAWHAYDSYRRFLGSYAKAAWDVDIETFNIVERTKSRHGVGRKAELSDEAMREIAEESKRSIQQAGFGDELEEVLANPNRQIFGAIQAVIDSWNGERVRRYREIKGLSHTWQTAVVVQQMAAGNHRNEDIRPGMDETQASLTGVVPYAPMTEWGYRYFTGDIKFSATGDDLVGGATAAASFQPLERLRQLMPMLERWLNHIDAKLRRFRGADPEIEFTVERGVLSILQARTALVETVEEPIAFDAPGPPDARGIGIRGGAFRGLVAFGVADIDELTPVAAGRDDVDGVLLVLENPIPDEIPTILAADALLTARGGSTSHAAVAVHGIEHQPFTAVMGTSELQVSTKRGEAVLLDAEGRAVHTVRRGGVVSIDGKTGDVYAGVRAVRSPDDVPAEVPEG